MPAPVMTMLDSSGNPLASCKLYAFSAGTSTPIDTYTDAALTTPNLNPVRCDSAGRVTVFLSPTRYKFTLHTSADVLVWSVDGVSAVPLAQVDLDVQGVAGETLAAGNVVYLSDGSGSLTAGKWYKADADLGYASSLAGSIGVATTAIATDATGSIRLSGRVTGLSALTEGAKYYVSATAAGLVTTTSQTHVRFLGTADTTTSLILTPNPRDNDTSLPGLVNGRCTLESGVPISSTDQTGKTTLYFTPYKGNKVALYTGSQWRTYSFAQVSVAVPATTNQMYDVFLYDNAGTLTLDATAWTNDTTRATALAEQDEVFVKTGATSRLYICSFRTTGVSGQTEDSLAKRYVWNYYHRERRALRVLETANSWAGGTGGWRQFNNSTANQVDIVVGVAEVTLQLTATAGAQNNVGSTAVAGVGIGEGVVNAFVAGMRGGGVATPDTAGAGEFIQVTAVVEKMPAIGRQFYAMLEYSTDANVTFFGDNNAATITASGLGGWIEG